MTDMTNIIIAIKHRKLHVAFRLAYVHLISAHSKDQGQSRAHFDCEYFANSTE